MSIKSRHRFVMMGEVGRTGFQPAILPPGTGYSIWPELIDRCFLKAILQYLVS
jgi:hypothetical protein